MYMAECSHCKLITSFPSFDTLGEYFHLLRWADLFLSSKKSLRKNVYRSVSQTKKCQGLETTYWNRRDSPSWIPVRGERIKGRQYDIAFLPCAFTLELSSLPDRKHLPALDSWTWFDASIVTRRRPCGRPLRPDNICRLAVCQQGNLRQKRGFVGLREYTCMEWRSENLAEVTVDIFLTSGRVSGDGFAKITEKIKIQVSLEHWRSLQRKAREIMVIQRIQFFLGM